MLPLAYDQHFLNELANTLYSHLLETVVKQLGPQHSAEGRRRFVKDLRSVFPNTKTEVMAVKKEDVLKCNKSRARHPHTE